MYHDFSGDDMFCVYFASVVSETVANRKYFMFSVLLFSMLLVHLSFLSREGNPEPQNQKHILDLMNVISQKENISNWVIYSKVSKMKKGLIVGNYSILPNHTLCMYYNSHILEELLG